MRKIIALIFTTLVIGTGAANAQDPTLVPPVAPDPPENPVLPAKPNNPPIPGARNVTPLEIAIWKDVVRGTEPAANRALRRSVTLIAYRTSINGWTGRQYAYRCVGKAYYPSKPLPRKWTCVLKRGRWKLVSRVTIPLKRILVITDTQVYYRGKRVARNRGA